MATIDKLTNLLPTTASIADVIARVNLLTILDPNYHPEAAPTIAPAYTSDVFEFDGKSYTFTQAAFQHPVYGALVSDNLAENVGDKYPGTENDVDDILQDLLTRQSPILEEVVAAPAPPAP